MIGDKNTFVQDGPSFALARLSDGAISLNSTFGQIPILKERSLLTANFDGSNSEIWRIDTKILKGTNMDVSDVRLN